MFRWETSSKMVLTLCLKLFETTVWAFNTNQMVHFLWQSVDAILEDISVIETIIWYLSIKCSKHYGSLPHITWIKVAKILQTQSVLTRLTFITVHITFLFYCFTFLCYFFVYFSSVFVTKSLSKHFATIFSSKCIFW